MQRTSIVNPKLNSIIILTGIYVDTPIGIIVNNNIFTTPLKIPSG